MVRIDPLFDREDPARASGAHVTFEPCARTAWRPGDGVLIAPNEKHWHGAAPATAMSHIAIQERFNGKVVEWLEKVTDEQYAAF